MEYLTQALMDSWTNDYPPKVDVDQKLAAAGTTSYNLQSAARMLELG